MPCDAAHRPARQDRQRGRRHLRQIAEIIVDRLRPASINVANERGNAALALAGEKDDAEIERDLQIGRHFRQHGQAAADMEATDHHGNADGAQWPGKIEGAGKLIGLHADEADEASTRFGDFSNGAFDVNDGVALVKGLDVDFDVGAERFFRGALGHQPIHAG